MKWFPVWFAAVCLFAGGVLGYTAADGTERSRVQSTACRKYYENVAKFGETWVSAALKERCQGETVE